MPPRWCRSCGPTPADAMRGYTIGALVSEARNDGPECLAAVV
jgi:hypothetical protein